MAAQIDFPETALRKMGLEPQVAETHKRPKGFPFRIRDAQLCIGRLKRRNDGCIQHAPQSQVATSAIGTSGHVAGHSSIAGRQFEQMQVQAPAAASSETAMEARTTQLIWLAFLAFRLMIPLGLFAGTFYLVRMLLE